MFFFAILTGENDADASVCKEPLVEREAVCQTPRTSNADGILMTKVVQTGKRLFNGGRRFLLSAPWTAASAGHGKAYQRAMETLRLHLHPRTKLVPFGCRGQRSRVVPEVTISSSCCNVNVTM